jgi:hypothetical protein
VAFDTTDVKWKYRKERFHRRNDPDSDHLFKGQETGEAMTSKKNKETKKSQSVFRIDL